MDATELAGCTAYDEARGADGRPRPGYAEVLDALGDADLDALRGAVARQLERDGVSFGAHPFVVDPVPRLITAAEWEPLAAGLAQRARALNALLRDVYSEQRLVGAGVVDAGAIANAEGFEPELVGRVPASRMPAALVGFDVVREPGGEFLVLEDNLRAPSGFAYAVAARAALARVLPGGMPRPRPVDPLAFELLAGAIRAAAPGGSRSPVIVVLGDGPGSSAHYEHVAAARRLGATLATVDDLDRDGDALCVRTGRGRRRVDVVYRRTDDDALRDDDGEPTPIARLLLEPWCSGEIGLVNAFGNGAGDDKFMHGRVEDCIRFYLGEEPLVRSVPTRAADAGGHTPEVGELRHLVTKPRAGYGGNGVMIGAHADDDDLGRRAHDLGEHPERYVSQPIVALSRHPTVIGGRLEPRHVDLRAFAFCGDDIELLPGGLTRVALAADALVVNSSQDGGGKDTWVI